MTFNHYMIMDSRKSVSPLRQTNNNRDVISSPISSPDGGRDVFVTPVLSPSGWARDINISPLSPTEGGRDYHMRPPGHRNGSSRPASTGVYCALWESRLHELMVSVKNYLTEKSKCWKDWNFPMSVYVCKKKIELKHSFILISQLPTFFKKKVVSLQ